MKVIHFQRKPVSERYFSIENYFNTIRRELPHKEIQVKTSICRFISQGLFKRIYNAVEVLWQRADVYHVTGDVHYITLLLPKKRTVLTIHDCVFMQHPSKLARRVLKLFWLTLPAKRAGYITCVSEKTKEEVLRFVPFAEKNIIVIPTAVDDSLFLFHQKEFNVACPTILHIGTTPNKNIERVAMALKGISCKLIVIGPLSEDQQKILETNQIDYSNEIGISNEKMAEKYRESDLLLFASIYEGFGMPILEAQFTGRPVVTSNLSPMLDIAKDAACLVDPFEPESIREGVLKVINSESYRNDLIKRGLQNAANFSSHKIAGQFADLYRKITRDNKAL